jgi:NAD(P)-dependent dehydrogenase (short-subunit alcohol dehydrogenase family)
MNVPGVAALVTGGASGLGEATARALAAAGAKVAVLDMNLDGATAVADAIGGAAFGCDVTSADAVEHVIARAEAAHGVARILINCAGVATSGRTVGKTGPLPLKDFARVIEINVMGTFNMIRLMAARAQTLDPLDTGERAVIINTASVAAFDGQIGQAAYAASKGAVAAMTLPLAREFASTGLRFVTIAPGIFETPMIRGMKQEVQDSLAASIPFPSRLGRADEYAALALHIIANVMLNGETIRLDGAIRMPPK